MSATQTVYKNILKELRLIAKRSHKIHEESNLLKQKTLLEYKKLQLIKERKSFSDIDEKIKNLNSNSKPSTKFEETFKQIFNEFSSEVEKPSRVQAENFKNIHKFLNSQRTYQELIERYNPGITMKQAENVEKSANRVGLKVPQ